MNLRCRSETCCTRLAANAGCKKSSKICHLGTIAQISWAISLQLRHISTVGKKLVKQQYVLQMSPQYGVLRPSSGWDQFTSLWHACKFQRVSRLGSVTAWQSSSERQPNSAALNRGRHLCSAGRTSRWPFAHILVLLYLCTILHWVKKGCHPINDYNFVNSWSIFQILWVLQSAVNFQQNQYLVTTTP